MTFLALAFVSGVLFGFCYGMVVGARRGADRIVDQMINAELAAPDAIERAWPGPDGAGRLQ